MHEDDRLAIAEKDIAWFEVNELPCPVAAAAGMAAAAGDLEVLQRATQQDTYLHRSLIQYLAAAGVCFAFSFWREPG